MAKYRKKPVVIEAILWRGDKLELEHFVTPGWLYGYSESGQPQINTLENSPGEYLTATIGDYIIKGVKGEFYPCKPDIFEQTYDKVE